MHKYAQIHTDTIQIQRLKSLLKLLWAIMARLLFFKKTVYAAKMKTKPKNPNKLDSQ